MYVVLGATGQVGGAVARHLLEQKLSLRVVVRSAEKGEPFAAKGCEVAVADVLDTAALTLAFRGAENVFVLIPPLFDPSEGFPEARAIYASITTALKAARPGRVVCLSTVGAQASEPNLLNQLGLMEQEFGKLDIPVAFLRASSFMENFAWDIASAKDEGVVHSFLQPLERKIPMVATDDIGRTATGLLQEDWQGRRVVELQGPELLGPDDVANAFTRVLDRKVKADVVPRESWETIFLSAGMKNPTPRIQMLEGFNAGWISFEGGEVEQRTGSTTLEAVLAGLAKR